MSALWQPLREELKRCRAEGMAVPLWWRDDDAVKATPELDRLCGIAVRCGISVHLAVVPAYAEPSLAEATARHGIVIPLVHGWAHENHAPPGAKKAEFGHPRADGAAQIARAHERLKTLFGDSLLPVFVPPWNRFDPVFLEALTAAVYRGLSTFPARPTAHPAPGLIQINTHIDPIDWRGSRDLADPASIIAGTVAQLQARRAGVEDPTEPLGLLTHHLVHTTDVWHFAERFLTEMQEGGAIPVRLDAYMETGL